MEGDLWLILDRMMQWLILPAIAVIWNVSNRTTKTEQEVLRILTILEERNARHNDEKINTAELFKELRSSIDKLTDKLDKLTSGGRS
jgi:hypothetical protein